MNATNPSVRRSTARVLALIGALLWPGSARAGDKPAEWAPADVMFFLGFPDTGGLVRAFKQTAMHRAMNDPKLKESKNQAFETMRPMLDEALRGMGFADLDELEELGFGDLEGSKLTPQGGACLFVTTERPKAKEARPKAHLQVVAEMGDHFARFREALKKLARTRLDNGFKRETTEFRGVRIISVVAPDDYKPRRDKSKDSAREDLPADLERKLRELEDQRSAVDEESPPPPLVYAFKDRTVLIGTDVELTKQTLRRMAEKRSDCLAANSDYTYLERACKPVGQCRFFFNLPRLFQLTAAEAQDGATTISALGLDTWKPLVGTVRIARPEGVEYSIQMSLPIGSSRKGLSKILAMKNRPVAPPNYIDPDTTILTMCNLAPGEIFDEVLRIVERIDPDEAKDVRGNMEVPWGEEQEMVNIRSGIIGLLEGPFAFALATKKPFGSNSLRLALTIGHNNRAGLEKLLNAAGGVLRKREMLGQQVWEPAMQMPLPVSIALAVTDTFFAVGSERSIESAIRSTQGREEGLAGDSVFQSVARFVPDDAWLTIYWDSRRMSEFLIALLEGPGPQGQLDAGGQADSFSQAITAMIPMLVANQADPKTLKAQLEYEGQALICAATRGGAIDINMVGVVTESKD